MPSTPEWKPELDGYVSQQDDGSWLISRRQPDGSSGPWQPYQAAPAAAPQPTPQPAVAPAPVAAPVVTPVAAPVAAAPVAVAPVAIPQPTAMPAGMPQPGVLPTTPAVAGGMAAGLSQMMQGGGGYSDGAGILGAIDLSGVSEGARLIQPEKSVCVATIVAQDDRGETQTGMTKAKTSNANMIVLVLRIDYTIPPFPGAQPTQEFAGLTVYENIVLEPKTYWKFKNLNRVTGLLDASGTRFIGQSAKDYIGRQVGFVVEHNSYNNRVKNRVAGGFELPATLLAGLTGQAGPSHAAPPNGTGMPAAAPMVAAPVPQPQVAPQPQMAAPIPGAMPMPGAPAPAMAAPLPGMPTGPDFPAAPPA